MNKRLKKIGKALKVVLLSIAHMDYQMEFKKRKRPTLNVLEACHRLAQGRKRTKRSEKMKDNLLIFPFWVIWISILVMIFGDPTPEEDC